MSGLALASPRLLDHDDDQEKGDKDVHKRRNGDDENMLGNDHQKGILQEFAEHFMVQVWREGMQVWEDYRDDQVSPFFYFVTSSFAYFPSMLPYWPRK